MNLPVDIVLHAVHAPIDLDDGAHVHVLFLFAHAHDRLFLSPIQKKKK